MPGIGEGRKSSSFDPAGKRFSKAARGSAAWPPGGVCPGSAVAARAQNPAVQAARVKAARILNILGAPAELDSSTLRESGGSRDSSRTAQIPRPWALEPASRAGGAGNEDLSSARGRRGCRSAWSTDRCAPEAFARRADPRRGSADESRKRAATYAVKVLSRRRLSWNSA